jgi:hypothetical protein
MQEDMADIVLEKMGLEDVCKGILACQVCGKTEGIKKCGRCNTIGYCGKEHQKADWRAHKKRCIAARGE